MAILCELLGWWSSSCHPARPSKRPAATSPWQSAQSARRRYRGDGWVSSCAWTASTSSQQTCSQVTQGCSRWAQCLRVERSPGRQTPLKLMVDVGGDKLQVVTNADNVAIWQPDRYHMVGAVVGTQTVRKS
jgi:hypothetical protein